MSPKFIYKHEIAGILASRAPHLKSRSYLAAAHVFPFRINEYVRDKLIDWTNVPNDPIFRLVFPQPDMLKTHQLDEMLLAMDVVDQKADSENSKKYLLGKVEAIRKGLNPHPAGQKEENVPKLNGVEVEGIQHKYRETCLLFPSQGQFCHAYCTYCFRYAQFVNVGAPNEQFKSGKPENFVGYIAAHPDIQDVLFTGGDPMVMSTQNIKKYVDPLLHNPATRHLSSIRFGTKSLAYWPYRFTTATDAKDLLKLFEKIRNSGKCPTIQAHFSHPRELGTPEVKEAMRLIQMSGAVIRTQAPLIRGVNDSADIWTQMWRKQVELGAFPYYMFVERDTGAHDYFSVPLARAYEIFTKAQSCLSGTARSARGPSMSAGPGKIAIIGIEEIFGEKVFVLKFLQSRNPDWNERIFYAKFDPTATWFKGKGPVGLVPAFGESKFFFEKEYEEDIKRNSTASSGQIFTKKYVYAFNWPQFGDPNFHPKKPLLTYPIEGEAMPEAMPGAN